jgi:phosphate transport system ATP-binding protein
MERMTDEQRHAEQAAAHESAAQRGLSQAIAVDAERPKKDLSREKVFELKDVSVRYDGKPAVKEITFDVFKHNITALIGPSGCGKSTLIRCFNRMNDLIPSATVEGEILYHGQDLYGPNVDPVQAR